MKAGKIIAVIMAFFTVAASAQDTCWWRYGDGQPATGPSIHRY